MSMCYVHIFKCNYVIKLNLKKLETKTDNSLTTIKRAQTKESQRFRFNSSIHQYNSLSSMTIVL